MGAQRGCLRIEHRGRRSSEAGGGEEGKSLGLASQVRNGELGRAGFIRVLCARLGEVGGTRSAHGKLREKRGVQGVGVGIQ